MLNREKLATILEEYKKDFPKRWPNERFKTDEEITPDCCFNVGGNQIGATTLDLSGSFEIIKQKLDSLVQQYLL